MFEQPVPRSGPTVQPAPHPRSSCSSRTLKSFREPMVDPLSLDRLFYWVVPLVSLGCFLGLRIWLVG
jgi:hypothetical protein